MRLHYSVRTLILISALLLVAVSHVVLAIRHNGLQKEHAQLLDRVGAIQRRNDERLHMRRVEIGEVSDREWRLFIPKGRRYSVFMASKNILPQGPVQGKPLQLFELLGTGDEMTIALTLQEQRNPSGVNAMVRAKLVNQTVDAMIQFGESHLFLISPNNANGYCEEKLLGRDGTVIEETDQIVELGRMRQMQSNPRIPKGEVDPNPCNGLMLWVQQIDEASKESPDKK